MPQIRVVRSRDHDAEAASRGGTGNAVVHCHQCGVETREQDRFCSACGAAASRAGAAADPLLGRVIGDAYVVLDLIGVGGMGRVYRAEQRMLGRTVAIKVVHPHLLADEQSVARFYTEARAASRLNHPNSVSIIDFGRTDDGILYLVMEFLQGRDLSRLTREDGPLGLTRVCDIVCAILGALDEAHALGVVHRDLKPENVIIERLRSGGDLVKVVDFGLAKVLSGAQAGASITLPGLVCGTPDYMSPEQGRGEDMDGRSDIYSAGVLLYELLAERLPYIADTATNVVLRHIQDPIPDPRAAAPHRAIPAALAEIAMRALAKHPDDRFSRGEEMAAALREVATRLRRGVAEITCTACGAASVTGKRFCAECGAVLSEQRPSLPPRASMPPAARRDVEGGFAFVHRPELDALERHRERAQGGFVSVALVGEAGVGKTCLLAALAQRGFDRGDLVVGAEPHPSGAAVPYAPIQSLVLSLLGVGEAGLLSLADELAVTEPLVAAGLRELAEPVGLRGLEGGSRAGAVAVALAFAIREGLRLTQDACGLLLVDDLNRCDGLTAQVLAALPEHAGTSPVLLVIASADEVAAVMPYGTESLPLRGLTMLEAGAFIAEGALPPASEPAGDERLLLPLYLEQLRHLGLGIGSSITLPPRLADAVAQRLQRLDLSARRVLQAACVLGNRCAIAALQRLVDPADAPGIERLATAGLLLVQDDAAEVVHPFVRDLVEASIPAEARKTLHARALQIVSEENAPIEVRAAHAYGAGEAMSALMLLERSGDLASERGDLDAAVLAYRRGLDLARRELLETGEVALESALTLFSRRLGATLAKRGDVTGAEGVLREALEFAGASTTARGLVLLELGRVVGRRKRTRDAYRLFGEAIEIALELDDRAAEAFAHVAVAELRIGEANHEGAAESLRSALRLLVSVRADPLWCARVAVQLVEEVIASTRATASLRDAFDDARRLVADAKAPYLEARLDDLESVVAQARGDVENAAAFGRKAVRHAAEAGDARRALRRLGEESRTWPRVQAALRREAS